MLVCYPGCNVIDFEIELSVLPYDQKSQGKYLNILRTNNAFPMKLKGFSIILKGISVARGRLRSDSAPLKLELHSSKIIGLFVSLKLFKNDKKMLFISSKKHFLFSRYLSFCYGFLVI